MTWNDGPEDDPTSLSLASNWKRDRKIVTFPSHRSETPENVLLRTLEKVRAGHIAHVAILMVWEDGSTGSDWSGAKLKDLLFAAEMMKIEIHNQMREVIEQEVEDEPDHPAAS